MFHLFFISWFIRIKFTHEPTKLVRKAKEIVLVTPVKLYIPKNYNSPIKKDLLVNGSFRESLSSLKKKAFENPGIENNKKIIRQEVKIDKDPDAPVIEESGSFMGALSTRLMGAGVSPVVGQMLHSTFMAGHVPVLIGPGAYPFSLIVLIRFPPISQSFIVESFAPETIYLPSGLNDTLLISSE